ncbi:sugar phosphate isomerase/epimerase family protein [Halococcus agarilyticus]|uniref:sugar phosphate isomerase/epimerase family protein n=1 Tax=Halococcus agarilyticus TaxID=1232219 RepID=UPI0006777D58|nr:sugar phosphate isomerase/epimerase family protein [Halococcus agarilyticus]
MSAIRRGFVTQLGMGYEEAFEHAESFGLDYVELMMDGAHERTALADEADRVRALADERGLDLVVHLPFRLDIASPFEHVREGSLRELLAAIETAGECGAEKGVIHASTDAWPPAWEHDPLREHLLSSIRDLDAFGREREFELCVENVASEFFPAASFPRLFDETDASMTLDTGHARMNGMDAAAMADFLAEHGDRVGHLHLNDTRMPKDEHLPFGAGTIDFEQVFEPLRDGWTGTLSLEVFTDDRGYIETSVDRLDELL